MLELYGGEIMVAVIAGVAVAVIGAMILKMVRASLDSFILELQNRFVSQVDCTLKHDAYVSEIQSLKTVDQNHEARLNQIAA